MIKVIKSRDRHFSDFGWLQTHWLFSFSDYYDPDNIQFGGLRVFNDDVVKPGKGFPTHPHKEMEIVTIVLNGEMTHQDSMGHTSVIKAGDVQRMSAGRGLTHSEFNLAEEDVHFYQIWILPDQSRLDPSYDQKTFVPRQWQNKLLPVASGQGKEGAVTFHTDATIYRCDLDADKELKFVTDDGRRIFIYVTSGSVVVDGLPLDVCDQARIDLAQHVSLKAQKQSAFILIDIPSCKGWGYDKKTLRGSKS